MRGNAVRIIGGKLRGKKITFPQASGVRPTSDRIRETVFNWLMHSIAGARCLDAFAGSGALGIEAFSRGAKEIVFFEKSIVVAQHLKKICATINLTSLQVMHGSAEKLLHSKLLPFDIIFFDPPFAEDALYKLITLIEQQHLLNPGGVLYVESSRLITMNTNYWILKHYQHTATIHYAIYCHSNS